MYASEAGMDDEYSALMAELGETPAAGAGAGGGGGGHVASAGGGISAMTGAGGEAPGGGAGGRGGGAHGGAGRGGGYQGGRGGGRGFQNPRDLFGPPKGEEEQQQQANASMQHGYYGTIACFGAKKMEKSTNFHHAKKSNLELKILKIGILRILP